MLTAAGGPGAHPHAVSEPEERARWDRDMQNAEADLERLEAFFLATLDEELTEEETRKTAFSFYGVQGPWYTVGWLMAVTIEEVFGRPRLIECFCDPRRLLGTYNAAAREHNGEGADPLPLWSDSVVSRLGGRSH
jgi:hypothetical protein